MKRYTHKRKWILILMDTIAVFLLSFDRTAYIYKYDGSHFGGIMVRISNFMVFFLTSAIVLGFNLYLSDLLTNEGKLKKIPMLLKFVNVGAVVGMAMVVVSNFTGLYYYFDENGQYQRGPGFLLCYLVPVILPIMQYTVIHRYRRSFSRLIYTSLVLYIFVPIAVGILQIFTYGLSIVNMAMVLVSVSLYIFTYLDINNAVMKAHKAEVGNLQSEHQSMKRLFDQTVTAFVTAVEKRDPFSEGHSVRVAEYARRIAETAGKDEEECEEVYYAALLHDVGMIGIPDQIIEKTEELTEEEIRQKRLKPTLSAEILSNITEYPYLSASARYSCERYDGTGYPEGLKGKDIPEISRIIAVASAYDTMVSGNRSRAPMSYQNAREEFIKYSGLQFDPEFSEIMVQLMDTDRSEHKYEEPTVEKELTCGRYREKVSTGVLVEKEITRISFECSSTNSDSFSAPSIIVFASYDRHTHSDERTIKAYHYAEYGEVWFDGHYVSTNARDMEIQSAEGSTAMGYEIIAGRFEDHLSVRMSSPERTEEVIIALPDNSKGAYIGLTGENCHIKNIKVQKTGEQMEEGSVRKIIGRESYIDRLESDISNIQIDHRLSACTEGIAISDELHIDFHTMSLPSADLVWHCPYIIIFYSEDHMVGGKGYKEYALIHTKQVTFIRGKQIKNVVYYFIFQIRKLIDLSRY